MVFFRIYCIGRVPLVDSFARNAVSDVCASVSGSLGSKQTKRIELIIGDKAEKPGSRVDGDEADELVFQVCRALG